MDERYFMYEEIDWQIYLSKLADWEEKRNKPELKLPRRKPNMFDNIFTLLQENVIDFSDINCFSEKLVNDLKETLRAYNHNMYNK